VSFEVSWLGTLVDSTGTEEKDIVEEEEEEEEEEATVDVLGSNVVFNSVANNADDIADGCHILPKLPIKVRERDEEGLIIRRPILGVVEVIMEEGACMNDKRRCLSDERSTDEDEEE
jgi:hypothetical protein